MNKTPEPLPTFASEAEEREYWETHDSTERVNWTQARRAVLPNLKPSTAAPAPAGRRTTKRTPQ